MENTQTKSLNTRGLCSILTICMMVSLFVSFIIGTIAASWMVTTEHVASEYRIKLQWELCAPYLVFMIIAFIAAIIKFFVCTLPFKKEYPSKDTVKIQFWMEILGLVIILLGCISLAFIRTRLSPVDYTSAKIMAGPIVVSTLTFAFGAAIAGLTYHNYK